MLPLKIASLAGLCRKLLGIDKEELQGSTLNEKTNYSTPVWIAPSSPISVSEGY